MTLGLVLLIVMWYQIGSEKATLKAKYSETIVETVPGPGYLAARKKIILSLFIFFFILFSTDF